MLVKKLYYGDVGPLLRLEKSGLRDAWLTGPSGKTGGGWIRFRKILVNTFHVNLLQ
jgi:hypothetical protein